MINSPTDTPTRFHAPCVQYDQHADVQRTVARTLCGLLPPGFHPRRALDTCCGTGYMTVCLVDQYPKLQVTGVDRAPNLIQVAQVRFEPTPQIKWVTSEAMAYEPPCALDLITSSSALHWFSHPRAFLDYTYRILRPGGIVAIAVMLHDTLKELHEARVHIVPHKPPKARLRNHEQYVAEFDDHPLTLLTRDRKSYTRIFQDARALLHNLHYTGVTGGAVSQSHTPLSRGELKRLIAYYNEAHVTSSGDVAATYEVGYYLAQKPENAE